MILDFDSYIINESSLKKLKRQIHGALDMKSRKRMRRELRDNIVTFKFIKILNIKPVEIKPIGPKTHSKPIEKEEEEEIKNTTSIENEEEKEVKKPIHKEEVEEKDKEKKEVSKEKEEPESILDDKDTDEEKELVDKENEEDEKKKTIVK